MDTFDFLDNRVFDDRFSAFAPQSPQTLPGQGFFNFTPLDTGAKVQPSGDVRFGFYAPNAQAVSVVFGIKADQPLAMEKGENGVWSATLPYDPLFCGPKAFTFQVDGAPMLSPYCPMYYSHSLAINYVEIPDKNTPYILMRDVPHGAVSTEYYWAEALDTWQRCLVYTPPGYEAGGDYPVLYLQHGAGENETSWVYNGRANHILDNLIADGLAVPMLVVMNDGMVRGKNETGFGGIGGRSAFESTLIDSCIPFIEKKYRVVPDKWHRALAGFSMGSMQACNIGLTNTALFAYIGLLSGFMAMTRDDSEIPTAIQNSPTLRILADKERFTAEIKLFYRGIGSNDAHYESYARDQKICDLGGFDAYPNFVSRVVEGYPHDWAVLRILLHDFAQRLFR